MSMQPAPGVFGTARFGPFEYDERSGELRKHGLRIRLQGQPLQILTILLGKAGQVITREELQRALWQGSTFVDFENGLNAAVNRLRQALGDSADEPRYIETVPARGYRFIAPIQDTPVNSLPALAPVAPATRPTTAAVPELQRTGTKRLPYWISALVGLAIVAAFVPWWLSRPENPLVPRTVPLTTFAGWQFHPSFSPDGNQVAFAWKGEKHENWDIYVKMIGGGTALRLTDTARNDFPAWSPDGRRIAFLKFVNRGGDDKAALYSISPLGGPERELADFDAAESTLAWSQDGRFLVVARAYDEFQHDHGSGALYLMPAEGGDGKPLLTPPARHWFENPAVSPSGDSLAFISCWGTLSADTCDIFVVAVTPDLQPRGEPRQITHIARHFEGMTWAADGRSLIYSRGTLAPNDIYLWRIAPRPGAAPERLEIASAGAHSPAVTRQANRLAFCRLKADTDVWRAEVGKPARPFLVSSMADASSQFSPDGSRIAFASGRGMDGNHIWLAGPDGAGIVQLTVEGDSPEGSPRWSPDGHWIAFDVLRNGTRAVKIVEVASRRVRQLTMGPSNNSAPSWSRDGKWVYFRSDRSGQSEIWRMPFEGATAEQITWRGGYVGLESMDGKSLYYTKSGDDGPLFRKMLAGTAEEKVLPRVVSRGFAVFEDGIYYLDSSLDRAHCEIRFHEFASGNNRLVVGEIHGFPGLGLSVSPDRRSFLLTLWGNEGDNLMLIENFR